MAWLHETGNSTVTGTERVLRPGVFRGAYGTFEITSDGTYTNRADLAAWSSPGYEPVEHLFAPETFRVAVRTDLTLERDAIDVMLGVEAKSVLRNGNPIIGVHRSEIGTVPPPSGSLPGPDLPAGSTLIDPPALDIAVAGDIDRLTAFAMQDLGNSVPGAAQRLETIEGIARMFRMSPLSTQRFAHVTARSMLDLGVPELRAQLHLSSFGPGYGRWDWRTGAGGSVHGRSGPLARSPSGHNRRIPFRHRVTGCGCALCYRASCRTSGYAVDSWRAPLSPFPSA